MTSCGAGVAAALVRLADQLADLAMNVRKLPCVTAARSGLAERRYESGNRVEGYVDVGLASGNTVGFWIEFRWENGSWLVESSLRHNTDQGEDELVGLPTRHAADEGELAAELDGAMRLLTGSIGSLDLETL